MDVKKILIILGLAILAAFFTYSLIEYKKSGVTKEGVVACANGQCFWSAHLHVDLPIYICGEKYVLPKFKGPLAGLHTHGEENIIHWHHKIAFDTAKKQFTEPDPFALNLIFETLELPFGAEELLGKKDGDLCTGSASTWKVFVNGILNPDWRNYEWRDLDIVIFIFDARRSEEIEEELHQNPVKFPALEKD